MAVNAEAVEAPIRTCRACGCRVVTDYDHATLDEDGRSRCVMALQSRLAMQEQELTDLRQRVAGIPGLTKERDELARECQTRGHALSFSVDAGEHNAVVNQLRDRIRQLEAAVSAARRALEVG